MISNLNQTPPIILTDSFPKDVKDNFDSIVQDIISIIQNLFPGYPPAGIKQIYCRTWNGATPLTQPLDNYYLISLCTEPEQLYYAQFVYQLSHELGHVMLDPRRSNGMIETLASLISYKVLDELTVKWAFNPPYHNWKDYGSEFRKYRVDDEKEHVRYFEDDVQEMVNNEDWANLSAFMEGHIAEQNIDLASPRNRHLNCLGIILLRTIIPFPWASLKGLAGLTDPSTIEDPHYRKDLDIIIEKVPAEVLPLFQILGRT